MKWKPLVLGVVAVIGILGLGNNKAYGQDLGRYQALYIYNFTKYIQWPNAGQQVVIGVLGSGTINRELEKMVDSKRGDKLKFVKLSSFDKLGDCNIIFVAKDQERNLKSVLEKTEGKSILIISEDEKSVEKGAGISFFLEDDKLRFSINKSAVESRKMKISGSLLTLARVI